MYRYVYCITRVLQKPLLDLFGLENSPIQALQYRNIVAVLSNIKTPNILASNENVLCHAAINETIQREQTVLPMRFSAIFKNDEDLIGFLENNYAVFISDLNRLHDKLEMGLRVIMKTNFQHNAEFTENIDARGAENKRQGSPLQTTDPNIQKSTFFEFKKQNSNQVTSYLEQRRLYYAFHDQRKASVHEIVRTCQTKFEGVYTEYKNDSHASFLHGISLNFLIHKNYLTEFWTRSNDLMTNVEFKFLCSGPWPPYHFVSSRESIFG